MIDWRRVIEWPWFLFHLLLWAGAGAYGTLVVHLVAFFVAREPPAIYLPPAWLAPAILLPTALVGGFLWEVYERWRERANGLQEEHPVNRWVVDPLCALVGCAIGWAVVHFAWRAGA